MERLRKEQNSNVSVDTATVFQGRFALAPPQSRIATVIDGSPRMTAQRRHLHSIFGGSAHMKQNDLPIQRRAINAGELGGVTKTGEESIFDSRINSGALFTKTVSVGDHTFKSVIPAYRSAIRPIGNVVAAATYTDYNFANPVPMMPVAAPPNIITYLMLTAVGGNTVQATLHAPDQKAMENLFQYKSWPEVKTTLGLWHGTRDTLRANKNVNLIDPFVVRLTFESKKGGQHDWNIDTQFADSGTGYITRVEDGQHDITGSIVTAGDFATDSGNAANAGDEYIYSSTHVGAGGSFGTRADALAPHAGGDTKGAQHAGLDAITWMAAEGARFIPVGELGADATPTANFFTKPNKKGWAGAHNANLTWFMTNWGAIFHRAYNIDRGTMATEVDNLGVPAAITAKPAKPNYNLTNGVMEK